MTSFNYQPTKGYAKLTEEMASSLMNMWESQIHLGEKTRQNLNRQLRALEYDVNTIESWRRQLERWKLNAA